MRLRILVGTIILVLSLAVYGVAVAAFGIAVMPQQPLMQIGFYALAGIVWIIPAAWLTRWMQAAPPYRPPPQG
jgi:hypothetical protein